MTGTSVSYLAPEDGHHICKSFGGLSGGLDNNKYSWEPTFFIETPYGWFRHQGTYYV